jgi:hypothetical protein
METVASFAARWMDDYPRRKESTTSHYRQQIKALVAEHGHLRLDQLDRPTAREFRPTVVHLARRKGDVLRRCA